MNDIIERGKKAKKWFEDNWGIKTPENMIAIEKCGCGRETGFVWGMMNDVGQTRHLKNEYGGSVRKCGHCLIEQSKAADNAVIASYSATIKEYEEQKKLEHKEAKNKKSWNSQAIKKHGL